MDLRFRAATLDDAALASDLMTAAYPRVPNDPVMTRLRWAHPRRGFAYGHFLAGRGAQPIAYLGFVHGPWAEVQDRHCEVEVWLDRAFLDQATLVELFSWIGERAIAEQARILLAYCGEDEPEMLQALASLGYAQERIEKVWELDLAATGGRLVEEARAAEQRMAAAGFTCTTLDRWTDPDRVRKLYELNESTVQDIPHTLTIARGTLEDFERRLGAPDRPHDRIWIALDGDRPIGVSYLRFPPVRGAVWTGYTCTAREYRGRGVARAVKLQTLAQAYQLGVPLVYTDNDSENTPILRINEALGYRPVPGFVEHHKRVTSKGA